MKRWHWVTGLVVLLAVGCSTPNEEAQPETTPTPTPIPTVSPTPTPTPSATPTPTLPPVPPTPKLAALPLEGRNLKSCKDGHCRVTVRTGDRIAVPVETGGTSLRIKSIKRTEITMEQRGYGGGGVTTFTFFAPGPTGLGTTKLIVAFMDLKPGQAVMQIDI